MYITLWKKIVFVSLSGVALLLSGCINRELPRGSTPTARQFASWIRSAKEPELFWMRVGINDENEPVFEGGNRVHEGSYTELPMAEVDDIPYPFFIQNTREGDKLRVLMDTSSKESWCDFLAAVSWKVVPLKLSSNQTLPRHVVDNTFSYRGVTDRIKLNELRIENPLLNVRPVYETLGPIGRDVPEKVTPTVVIGNEIMSRFRTVHYDFPQRRIVLATTRPYLVEPDTDAVILPLKPYRGGMAIPVRINGKKMGAVLDTGGDYGIILDGASDPTSTLQIGDIEMLHVMTLGHDARGLSEKDIPRIGMHVLKDFRLTFDFKVDVDGAPQWRAIVEKPFVEDQAPTKRFNILPRRDESFVPPDDADVDAAKAAAESTVNSAVKPAGKLEAPTTIPTGRSK